MRLLTIGLMATALLVSGCSKDKSKNTASEAKSDHDHSMHSMAGKDDPHAGHGHSLHGMHHMESSGKVVVPSGGKKFEPPIKAAQLPANVWYCEMGTVHYARGENGDGKCPVCGMKLKHKVASK